MAAKDELAAEKLQRRPMTLRRSTPSPASRSRRICARASDRSRSDHMRMASTSPRCWMWCPLEEGGAARARAVRLQRVRDVHLQKVREDQPGAGAVPRAAARLCEPEPAGHDPVRGMGSISRSIGSPNATRRGHRSSLADKVGCCAAINPSERPGPCRATVLLAQHLMINKHPESICPLCFAVFL